MRSVYLISRFQSLESSTTSKSVCKEDAAWPWASKLPSRQKRDASFLASTTIPSLFEITYAYTLHSFIFLQHSSGANSQNGSIQDQRIFIVVHAEKGSVRFRRAGGSCSPRQFLKLASNTVHFRTSPVKLRRDRTSFVSYNAVLTRFCSERLSLATIGAMSTTRNAIESSEWQSMDMVDEQDSPETRVSLSKYPLVFIRRVARAPSYVTAALSVGVFVCIIWIFAPPGLLHGFRPGPGPGPPPPQKWKWPPLMDDHSPKPKLSGVDWDGRAEDVKKAFLHAYHGYEQYAMPSDELRPVSNGAINK